jgi:hypothetical protein
MADDGQWGPTIRAAELQGRHLGLFIDRKEISVEERSVIRAPEPLTHEEWRRNTNPMGSERQRDFPGNPSRRRS